MLTQCPACGSTFRVSAAQLKAKAGRVRCGLCETAFNALDNLQDTPENIQAHSPVAATQAPPDELAPTAAFTAPTPDGNETAPVTHWTTEASGDAANAFSLDEIESENPSGRTIAANLPEENPPETPPEPLPATPPAHAPTAVQSPHDNILLDDSFNTLTARPLKTAKPYRHWLWMTGCTLMTLVLIVQGIAAFHAPLIQNLPAAKPIIASLCQHLNCPTRLPAHASFISIESSDLHPDPDQPEHLTVSATLKNRATFAQQFPHLELTLTDINDKVVLRKVLPPATYLSSKTSIKQGMPALADVSVNLVVDIDSLTASGYRLYLFYP
jgi:predicted Zn finger-like uncharacterized protein